MQINPSIPPSSATSSKLSLEQLQKDIDFINSIHPSYDVQEQENISILNSGNGIKLPGCNLKTLTIKTADVNVNIKLYVSNKIDEDKLNKIHAKLTKALKNMPPNVLEDFSKECRTIIVVDEIMLEKHAYAQAIGPLDQIFLSASKMSELSDEDFETTITHELGHLIDNYYGLGSICSMNYQHEFEDLKSLMTEELGFNTSSHTLDNVREFYADNYLSANYDLPDNHRAKNIFSLLNQYSEDVKTLPQEELKTKYADKTDKIISLINKWNVLHDGFAFYKNNINNGVLDRMGDANPQTYEQIIESQK